MSSLCIEGVYLTKHIFFYADLIIYKCFHAVYLLNRSKSLVIQLDKHFHTLTDIAGKIPSLTLKHGKARSVRRAQLLIHIRNLFVIGVKSDDISCDILCFRESRRDARGPPWNEAANRLVTENHAVIYRYGKFHETPATVFDKTTRRYKSFPRLIRSHRLSRSDYDTREETSIAT